MKRKNAMEKLKTPNIPVKQTTVNKNKENTQKKNWSKARKKTEEKEQAKHTDEDAQREITGNKEEAAKKKAEKEKKKAEKEKARANKEREKAEKDKERVALKERDNNVLEQMNSMARTLNEGNTLVLSDDDNLNFSDEEEFDYFEGSDVVADCCTILTSSPISKLTSTSSIRNTNQSSRPQSQPISTIGGKRPKQHNSSAAHQQRRPGFGGKRPRQQESTAQYQQQQSTTGGKRPRQQQTIATQGQQQWPTIGGLRSMSISNPSCQNCEEFIQIITSQNEENAQLKAQGNYGDNLSLFYLYSFLTWQSYGDANRA